MELNTHLFSKITLLGQDNYLIVLLEEALTDTEFIEFKNMINGKVSEDSVDGLIIDLKSFDVIDSFTTRILTNIALLIKEKGVPMILTGIKPVVAEVMKRQGLIFHEESVNVNTDLSTGISQLDKLIVNKR